MPNGNDEWSQYKRAAGGAGAAAPATDEWDEFKRPGPTPAQTKLEKSAAFDSSVPAKLGRGFVMGAESGTGVPETESGLENVKGFAKNVGTGLARAGSAVAEDVGSLFVDPFLPKDKRLTMATDPVLGVAKDIGRGLDTSSKEAWQGLKDRDPEQFAHGFGSALTQVLMLDEGRRGSGPEAIGERARLSKTSAALDIGKGQIADLKTAMPEIVKQAQAAGIDTVGEFGKKVKDARRVVDDEFNQGMAPFRNQNTLPTTISQRIRNLVTPDMAKTAEGRMQVKEIMARAREYDKPWTYNELNAKRMTENENLSSFYNRDTRAQAASPLDTSISKAIRDGAADIVYQKWDQTNPGGRAQALKSRQGALWGLDDYVNNRDKGLIAELEAKQLQHEGRGVLDRVKARAAVHGGGISVYGTSSLLAPFERGPMEAASSKIREAFPGRKPTPFKRVKAAALPISVLVGRQTPFDQTSPPPPDTPDENASE